MRAEKKINPNKNDGLQSITTTLCTLTQRRGSAGSLSFLLAENDCVLLPLKTVQDNHGIETGESVIEGGGIGEDISAGSICSTEVERASAFCCV